MAIFMMPAIAQEDVSIKDTIKIETRKSSVEIKNKTINHLSEVVNNLEKQRKEITFIDIYTHIFGIIGIISLLFALVAYRWSIKQNKKQSLILDEYSNDLKETLRDIDNMRQNFTTDIPDFPYNIKNIIDLMDECLYNKSYIGKQIEFEIFTDVSGYGMLSYNDKWNDYRDKISSICRRRPTRWYFYNDEKQVQQIAHQFEYFKESENHDKLAEFIERCQKNALIGHAPECYDAGYCPYDKDDKKEFKCPLAKKKECYFIKTMDKNYDSLMQKTIELQQFLKENISDMENQFFIKVTRMDKELPFFGWFIVENINNKRIPLKAIITVPFGDQNCEKGFYTEKEKLLYAFYNTLHEHVKDIYN